LRSRKFAKEVLSPAIEAEFLPTPEERLAATKPAYEAMIAAGYLRKCIPLSAGDRGIDQTRALSPLEIGTIGLLRHHGRLSRSPTRTS
jgi:hypothetical protein